MFSGVVLPGLAGVIIAPFLHRVLHRLHIDDSDDAWSPGSREPRTIRRAMTDDIWTPADDTRVIAPEHELYNARLVRRESTTPTILGYFLGPLRRRADAVRARPVHDDRRVRRRQDRPAAVLGRVAAGSRG